MLVEFRQVHKGYYRKKTLIPAVSDFSWQLSSGKIYGLLGRNAAGKTSLVRMLLDFIRPDRGQILIDGNALHNKSKEFRRSIGYLPEERGLYRTDRVIDLLVFFAKLKGLTATQAQQKAMEELEYFGLLDHERSRVSELSKGLAQLIQFISCTLHSPQLCIFDEPFSGLDPVHLSRVRERMRQISAQGRLVICSTHLMAQAEEFCDEIVLLRSGLTLLSGELESILKSHAQYDFMIKTKSSLSALPTVAYEEGSGNERFVRLKPGRTEKEFLAELANAEIPFEQIRKGRVSLESLFISLTSENPQ